MSGDPSASARRIFADLLEACTGQVLGEGRAWRLETALTPLLRELEVGSLDCLAARLAHGGEPKLRRRVVEALLNQETSFFRDPGVFEALVDALEPLGERRARIWSAGCATGQEALSLAMLFAERGRSIPELVATDLSDAALARARAGRFTHFEIQRGLPMARLARWFHNDGEAWIARPELVTPIAFRTHNLIADAPPAGGFDAVLCRNVLLYLSPAARRRVLDRIAGVLRPHGVLALGAGETTIGQSERFRPSARFRGLYELAQAARAAA